MTKIIESTKAQYDTVEVPFGRSYRWHQAHVVLECDCGEKLTFSATSAINASSCRCGADYGALIHTIRYREEHPRAEDVQPWHYDLQSQEDQHQQDEAAHPSSSRWRYNDITSGFIGADEERWKKTRAPGPALFFCSLGSGFPRRPPLGSSVNRSNLPLAF